MNTSRAIIGTLLLAAHFLASLQADASPGDITLISGLYNASASGPSREPRISGDGRYIVFETHADLQSENGTSGCPDLVVFDRQSSVIRRVGARPQGNVADNHCSNPSISSNGRYIAFSSSATNLAANDTGNSEDVLLFDQQTGVTENISFVTPDAVTDPYNQTAISADGRFVAFVSSGRVLGRPRDKSQVYVRDRQLGTTEIVGIDASGGNPWSNVMTPAISADGRYVAFTAYTGPILDDFGHPDIVVRDRQTGVSSYVSTDTNGNKLERCVAPSLSADGRVIAFQCLDNVYVKDRQTGVLELVSATPSGAPGNEPSYVAVFNDSQSVAFSSLSADGRYVLFTSRASNIVAGDTNDQDDVFVRDRLAAQTSRINVGPDGTQEIDSGAMGLSAAISADGRFVAFGHYDSSIDADDTNGYEDIFVHDRTTGSQTLASRTNVSLHALSAGGDGSISSDGRYVFFDSWSASFVRPDRNATTDVFRFDRSANLFERVSLGSAGEEPDGPSFGASSSADGRYVAFVSDARNLTAAPGGTQRRNIFARDMQTQLTQQVSLGIGGAQPNGDSGHPRISASGRYVVFDSQASNLVANDGNGSWNAFVFDRQTQSTQRAFVDSYNESYTPSISGDGRYVAFTVLRSSPNAADDFQAFLWDLATGAKRRISTGSAGEPGNGASYSPMISTDGRYVAFASNASNLVPGDVNFQTDIFVFDRDTGAVELASTNSVGQQSNGFSRLLSISPEGRFVAFVSEATNLAPGGSAGSEYLHDEIFTHDRVTGVTQRVPTPPLFGLPVSQQYFGSLSRNGRYLAMNVDLPLSEADTNSQPDTYLYERATGPGLSIRINAGGGSYLDGLGQLWAGDSGYNTGSASTSAAPIGGTTDDALYQSVRWDEPSTPELRYTFGVPDGIYIVLLHFAETNASAAHAGGRVFDVDIEGVQRFDNLDIYAQAGGINRALVKRAIVTVTDGHLDILFRHQLKNPMVSAIEIIEAQLANSSPTTIRTNVGGGAYRDASGYVWSADFGFSGGEPSRSTAPIAGTTDDALYQSIRWDDAPAPEMEYSYDVPNGNYAVTLHFNESNAKTAYAGARLFDVDIEGIQHFDNVDVFAESGGLNRALAKRTSVIVTDGRIDIRLRHQVKNPILSAIEIVRE